MFGGRLREQDMDSLGGLRLVAGTQPPAAVRVRMRAMAAYEELKKAL